MRSKYTAIVIGSGPAGIFAGRELGKAGIETLLIEKGKPVGLRKCPMSTNCYHCTSCHEVEGVGGAGGYSDGKLCNAPVGIADEMIGDSYWSEMNYVNRVFSDMLGAKYQRSDDAPSACSTEGVREEITEVVFVGTSNIRQAFDMLYEDLPTEKISNRKVMNVGFAHDEFIVRTESGDCFTSKYLLVATGKSDFSLTAQLINVFDLETLNALPAFGIRLEVPKEQMTHVKSKGSNPKIKRFYTDGEYVKTHCLCYGGEVIVYACGPYMLVGGRSDGDHQTPYANVNLLYKSNSGETTDLIIEALSKMSEEFPNNVVCQDISSFMGGSRNSILRVEPGRGKVFGNLAAFYPARILHPLQDFIITLTEKYGLDVFGGLAHGPAVEWIKPSIDVSLSGESCVKGLFFIGDTSGKTQGIIAAAVMGVRAAREIVNRESPFPMKRSYKLRYPALQEMEEVF